jgi:pimeloyl-ACP methyl ester carboxylesterase
MARKCPIASIIAAWLVLGSTLAPAADLMPQTDAAALYSAQLGTFYHPADAERLYAAHQLIEQYFSAATERVREAIVTQLSATGLDPALLGRLCRLRLSWQQLTPGVYYISEQAGVYPVKYFLGIPQKYRREVAWPLVVMLPTANAFLTTPPPDADQVAHIYSTWIKEELDAHPDAIVLMPLLNLTELYGPSYLGVNSVIQPILNAAGKANVDPARVYLVGHSMAASAVWHIALHYPTYLAAINPLAGSATADWQRLRMMNLRNVLPVVWADTDDPVTASSQSGEIVSALRKLKIDVEYDQTNGVGHAPRPDIIQREYQKMRARTRQLYPPRISLQSDRPDAIYNRNDWVQVYQELDSGNFITTRLVRGTGTLSFFQNAYTLDATLSANTVKIFCANVDSFRLYFNDQMVDMTKPVTVIANGKQRFSGLLQPSLDDMLKDQLFLGRGWRYYTAVLDVDMEAPAEAAETPSPAAQSAPTSRPHGRITLYNPDGSIQKVIEMP